MQIPTVPIPRMGRDDSKPEPRRGSLPRGSVGNRPEGRQLVAGS